MPVSNLITPVNAGSTYPTIPAGASRRIFATVVITNSSATNVTSPSGVTIGGVAAEFISGTPFGTSQLRKSSTTVGIKESQVASLVGSSIVVSDQSGNFTDVVAWAVQDATQQSLTQASQFITTGAISIPLARDADSWTFFSVATQVNEDITLTNPARTSRISSLNIGYAAGTAQTVNSTGQSKTYVQDAHVINIPPPPAQSITSVNDDDEINAGAVNTAEVAGYVVGVNPVVSGTVGSLALTGVSQTGTTVSFTPPAPTNAAYWPEPDTTKTLTLTDGTNPSTFSAPFRPLSGYTSVVIASPDNADEYKLGFWSTFPLEDDDVIMFDPPNPPLPGTPITGWDVNPDGSFTNAPDGLKTWYHWRNATSLMYIYEATIGGGVITDNRGLSVAGVSVTGLSVSGLSVTGL